MKRNIDEIISECLSNIFEAKIDAKNDSVIRNAQKRVTDYMKKLSDNGDENLDRIMRAKGFKPSLDKNEMLSKLDDNFPDMNISQEVNQDVINTVKLLKQYSNGKGGFNFEKLKKDYPNNYDDIIRMKNFIDIKGLTRMYDPTANIPSHPYGIKWGNDENIDDLDFNSISDSEAKKYRGDKLMSLGTAKFKIKESLVNRYMQAKYGVQMKIPNISFSNGNAKVPENTLIINFTSAIGCPAWNECLVKHACYARQGEKEKPTVWDSNEKRSLFWLTTQHDDKLLSLMMDFARSYCFNYSKVAEELIKRNLVKGKTNPSNLAIKISKLQLDDTFFTSEIIEVMKEFKRIDYIRLNENGDFVGQWLVDAWDNEAGKYQPYDINVSAYTCRHLNYEGIKNIIINTSFKDGKGNIARRFIAIPENIYDALDETYGGKNNQLIPNAENIKPFPQPLYNMSDNNTLTPNGKYYYKCPCGRKNGSDKVSCYQCSLCYQPKTENYELFVFVKAHGAASSSLKGYDLIENNIGVSQNFINKYKNDVNVVGEDYRQSRAMLKMASNDGIKNITNNAINSTYQHFNSLRGYNMQTESKVIKIKEQDLIKLIKESISKNIK